MTKKDQQEVLASYKEQIKLLKSQLAEAKQELKSFKDQIFHLQNGLLSIRAPQAYADMVYDKIPKPEVDPSLVGKGRAMTELREGWMKNLEGPLFKSADDLTMMLSGTIAAGKVGETRSLHNNDES